MEQRPRIDSIYLTAVQIGIYFSYIYNSVRFDSQHHSIQSQHHMFHWPLIYSTFTWFSVNLHELLLWTFIKYNQNDPNMRRYTYLQLKYNATADILRFTLSNDRILSKLFRLICFGLIFKIDWIEMCWNQIITSHYLSCIRIYIRTKYKLLLNILWLLNDLKMNAGMKKKDVTVIKWNHIVAEQ